VDYLGHTISGQGVTMDSDKVQAMLQWPIPVTIKQLRRFLGLTRYYRKFIKSYAMIVTPLTELLKKDNFIWGVKVDKAFNMVKRAITQALVLALLDFSQPFNLENDVSGIAIGAVLSQMNHSIAYFSKRLSAQMQNQSAYAKEFLLLPKL